MMQVKADRLLDRLDSLAQIGRDGDGVSRPAFSQADAAGRAWFRAEIAKAGLDARQDAAGNISAVLPSSQPRARTLLAGSHLDTVPNGGRYDGALGVLAALEALQTIHEAGLSLPHHLEAISFTDEEGAFLGTFGSLAFSGLLEAEDLRRGRLAPREFDAGLERLGLTRAGFFDAHRAPESLLGYLEVHIEQGSRLEEAQIDIGVVTAIVGIRSYWLRFEGQAAHAGTAAMSGRADALWGAADFIRRARELVMADFSPGVMNCGQIQVNPGSFNIVPGEARLALEFRHSSSENLDEMERALLELAQDAAQAHRLRLSATPLGRSEPAAMDATMMQMVEEAAEALALSHTRLLSLAGHDARSLSQITPTAMIFVPSVDGVSHNPHEFTGADDVINGANLLLHTILRLCQADRP